MLESVIEFTGAHAGWGAVTALHDVTLTFGADRVTGLVGESGSGKTTLLRAALGLVPLRAGSVTVGGIPVAELLAHNTLAFRARAQLLPQDAMGALSPRMTVRRTSFPVARRGGSRRCAACASTPRFCWRTSRRPGSTSVFRAGC